jgi:hypothetical protein
MNAVCLGSYLSIAHNDDDETLVTGLATFYGFYRIPVPSLTFRSPTRVAEFFGKLDLVKPGIVPIPLWRPEEGGDLSVDPECFPACCGLGRKL